MADTVRTDLPFAELEPVPPDGEIAGNGSIPGFDMVFGGVQHFVFGMDPPEEA